jgi:hypothetical protein
VSGVERSSVRGRKPEFEPLALLIETAAVENRSVAPADRGILPLAARSGNALFSNKMRLVRQANWF